MQDRSTMTVPPAAAGAATSVVSSRRASGWMWFAVYALTLVSIAQLLSGFMALLQPRYYAARRPAAFIRDNYTAWGWIHLALGVLTIIVIVGLSLALPWARLGAVLIALLSAFAQFGFMSADPWWATFTIVIDILIIYAVTVHGGEPVGNA